MRTFVLCLCRDMNNDIERPSYLFVFHPISPLNKTKKHARLSIRSGRQKIAAAPTAPQELFWFDDGKPLQTGYIVVDISLEASEQCVFDEKKGNDLYRARLPTVI